LIRETTPSPARAYRFKHALTQETAYGSILFSRRRELHRRVAECLEQITPDRVNDLARHWLEAEDEAQALRIAVRRTGRAGICDCRCSFTLHTRRSSGGVENGTGPSRCEGLARALAGQLPQAAENYHTMPHYAGVRSERRTGGGAQQLSPPRCTSATRSIDGT
jgi:hypothetical protein